MADSRSEASSRTGWNCSVDDPKGTGEPSAVSARLTGDMQTTASHASHDALLVAALADHGLAAPERDAAEALVAACSLCAGLYADLVALSAATRSMPIPTRTRDYRLTPETAAALRPKGWRRWIAAFGTSRDMLSRPLAVGLTTLGLAGLLVATVPSVLQVGGATSGSAARDVTGAPAFGALPEAAADPTRPAGAAAAPSSNVLSPVAGSLTPDQGGAVAGGPILDSASQQPAKGAVTDGTAKGSGAESEPTDAPATAQDLVDRNTTGVSPMILVSGVLLVVGLALFAIRRGVRRFSD